MKTRFDSTDSWATATGEVRALEDMTTPHLMNLYAMFIRRPDRTMAMLVADIESGDYADRVWKPTMRNEDTLSASISNATKMTTDELVSYALQSPLGEAIKKELVNRGVDVENTVRVLVEAMPH